MSTVYSTERLTGGTTKIKLEFGNVGFFEERGKPENPEKNLLEQGREPTTNSTHIWHQNWESNLGCTGGRWVLSPLHHPCSPNTLTSLSLEDVNHVRDMFIIITTINYLKNNTCLFFFQSSSWSPFFPECIWLYNVHIMYPIWNSVLQR